MKRKSTLKIWTVITNVMFIISLFVLGSLLNNEDLNKYGLLSSDFLLMSVLIILTFGLTIASAVSALTLNAIYFPKILHISASTHLLRLFLVTFFLVTLNTIVFLGLSYVIINYIY